MNCGACAKSPPACTGVMSLSGGIFPGRGEDGAEQLFGFRAGTFATTVQQVVVGRTQREEPVTGVYDPVDEGLDLGQRLLVGPGDKPTVAKVPTQEVKPVSSQFAGQFTLKGADASPEGLYFTSHNAVSPDGLFAGAPFGPDGNDAAEGEAGNFRIADICGHFRTFAEGARAGRGFEAPVGSGQLGAGGLFNHQSSCCLSGLIGLVHVQRDVERDNR